MREENKDVIFVGRIDIARYADEDEQITTDEVVLTKERIRHIQEHHPNDFEKYGKHIPDLLADPDYVLKDRHPYTRIVIKNIQTEDGNLRLTLRLHTVYDESGYKNSILTFQYIRAREYERLSKTKVCVYKSPKK